MLIIQSFKLAESTSDFEQGRIGSECMAFGSLG